MRAAQPSPHARIPSPLEGEGPRRRRRGEGFSSKKFFAAKQTPLPPSLGYRLRSGTLPLKGGGEDERGERFHADLPSFSSVASIPNGPWVAARIIPPAARCRRMSSVNRSWPASSSAEAGSSSSQIDRGTATRRASDSRRRWPAER